MGQVRLRRALTVLDYFMLSLTGMVGSGWLFAALGAAGYMGPAAILSWVIAGILFIFMVFSFAELGGLFPFSGALARYNHYSHGVLSNYILAWAYALGAITTVSVEAIAIVEYASYYAPALWNSKLGVLTPLGVAAAAALIMAFLLIQVIGVNIYGWFNRFITAWKLIVPLTTVILLMALYFHPDYVVGHLPGGFAPYGYAAVFSGMITSGIVWAYQGFRQGLEYAGEGKNPQRDVPLGVITAILVTVLLYILLQIAFIGAVNWQAAGVKPGDWQALASSDWQAHPFVSEAVATGIPLLIAFSYILLSDAVISPAGTLAVYVGTAGRNLYGMGRMNYIPSLFSRIHTRFQTPWIALLIGSIIALAFLVPHPEWYTVMSYSTVATLYGYLMAGITNHALRRLAPDLRRPFNPPAWQLFYPLSFLVAVLLIYWSGWSYVNALIITVLIGLPLLILGPYRDAMKMTRRSSVAFAIIYWVLLTLIVLTWYLGWLSGLGPILSFIAYWISLSLLQVGVMVYLWFKSGGHPDVKAASWIPPFNILIGAISYIGSLGPLSTPLIPYPWDYLVITLITLAIYYYAVRVAYETPDLREIKLRGLPIE
ncbi:APC family permease [Vulcanisaeta thermophila]|uniref:APC family permease n=1 Tax=Vulcanisaeta thermophila TaxID=867917 RepID=UPI00117F1469|nr:APC family permease [Vulcanisaeta thermophila]